MIPWLAAAFAVPLLGRFVFRRPPKRPLPGSRAPELVHLALCAVLWILVAWRAAAPAAPDGGWNLRVFFSIIGAGVIWVEAWFLLAAGKDWFEGSRGLGGLDRTGLSRAARPGSGEEPARSPAGDGDRSVAGMPERGEAAGRPESLSPQAGELLERIRQFTRIPVEAIMTPREAVVSIEATASVQDALDRMRRSGRSRIVVVEGSLDRILGVVHLKDLAHLPAEGGARKPVRALLRRWLRIPKGRSASRVLEDFRKIRVHVGVVGDARGRTLGLVTLGDVFRYLGARDAGGGTR